jgi:beta-N-acetylhexosaminidase
VSFYDDYIQTLAAKVEDGTISEARIDESVTRILKLKEKYGILDPDQYAADEDEIEHAKEVIGSAAHHEIEMEIAKQAITLLKNENAALPLSTDGKKIVFLGRQKEDAYTIRYALSQMKEQGVLEENVTFDYYFDPSAEEDKLHYTDELRKAISEADVVVGLTKTYNLGALEESSEQYQGIAQAIEDTHAAGGRFVLLSNNLPYDAARFQDADAILLAYMGSGLDMDPTERALAGGNMGPYNANVVAAVHLMFGDGTPNGILPVQIPEISISEDGSLAYADKILYERGFGLNTF